MVNKAGLQISYQQALTLQFLSLTIQFLLSRRLRGRSAWLSSLEQRVCKKMGIRVEVPLGIAKGDEHQAKNSGYAGQ
jgi:hypothetical protein